MGPTAVVPRRMHAAVADEKARGERIRSEWTGRLTRTKAAGN
jgi:hypothetical protein